MRVSVILVAMSVLACGGDGGSARDGAAGGPDGAAGGPDAFSGGTPTVAEVALACVRAAACGFGSAPYCFREGGLVDHSAAVACVLAAGTDCDVLPTCLGFQPFDDPACTPRCEGDRAEICYQGRRLERDCAAEGVTCVVSGGPICSAGSCDEIDDPGVCDGTVVRQCSAGAGLFRDFDCALYGWTCVAGDGEARCTDGGPTPPSCGGEGKRCDGADLVWCLGGFEVRQHCGDFVADGTCQDWGGVGCGASAACNPNADDSGTCSSATTLSMCAGGLAAEYDCVALGYTRCDDGRCLP